MGWNKGKRRSRLRNRPAVGGHKGLKQTAYSQSEPRAAALIVQHGGVFRTALRREGEFFQTAQGGIGGQIALFKSTLAVIDPHRHGLARESYGDDDVQVVVSIDIARREMQSEHGGSDDRKTGMLPGRVAGAAGAEIELQPVDITCALGFHLSDRHIRPAVSIEVGDGEPGRRF